MGYTELGEIEDIVNYILSKVKSLRIKGKCNKILSLIYDLRMKENTK